MIANYHTHTWRCRHARGREKEYVEEAIKGGLKVLGFSDHTPQVYPGGYVCPAKMEPRELEGYVDCVLALKKEYRDDI
jgi:histidinol-phosphatase (PHP family)